MKQIDVNDVFDYVEKNIGIFHAKRIESIDNLKLSIVLKRKNPYLFKAKNILTSDQLVRNLVDAHISSNEETLFGDWLEGLAIFVNSMVYGGFKSGIPGIDLEFDNDGIRYIVSIKSGPNWGNSSQIKKMVNDFKTAGKTLRTSNSNLRVIGINGCCYGKDRHPDKGDYFKYYGQKFWEFISGSSILYLDLIQPLGHLARERNEEFNISYSRMINKFVLEFSLNFCNTHGSMDWEKLVKFNSAKET